MSPGSRSGVNWMRRKGSPSSLASALHSSVLPRPGRPSSSTWPRASTATTTCSTTRGWSSSTWFNPLWSKDTRSAASRPSAGLNSPDTADSSSSLGLFPKIPLHQLPVARQQRPRGVSRLRVAPGAHSPSAAARAAPPRFRLRGPQAPHLLCLAALSSRQGLEGEPIRVHLRLLAEDERLAVTAPARASPPRLAARMALGSLSPTRALPLRVSRPAGALPEALLQLLLAGLGRLPAPGQLRARTRSLGAVPGALAALGGGRRIPLLQGHQRVLERLASPGGGLGARGGVQ